MPFPVSVRLRARYIGAMTTASISSASPIMSASVQNLNKPAAKDSSLSASSVESLSFSDLNSAHKNGVSSLRTGLQIVPSPTEAANALQSSALQIARLQSNPEQPTARAAAAAYQTQAGALTRLAEQTQSVGSLKINMTA
jgi:hypothetical protein